MFADATLMLLRPRLKKKGIQQKGSQQEKKNDPHNKSWWQRIVRERSKLKDAYAIVFGAIIPLSVFFLVRTPVDILSIAGTVAAVHTPVIVFLTLYLNMKRLPKSLQLIRSALAAWYFLAYFLLHLPSIILLHCKLVSSWVNLENCSVLPRLN